jgi:hypothetical protein
MSNDSFVKVGYAIVRMGLERLSTRLAMLKHAYSVKNFCLAFDIGRSSVYEEIRSGRLKARKSNNRTLITHEDGIAWLNALPVVPTQSPVEPQGPQGTADNAVVTGPSGPFQSIGSVNRSEPVPILTKVKT